MISIAQVTGKVIKELPFAEAALSMGILNLSALARRIRPRVSEIIMYDVQEGAIVMALKRLSADLSKKDENMPSLTDHIKGFSVLSDLCEFTYKNSETISKCGVKLMALSQKKSDVFCDISRGIYETTIIASTSLRKDIARIFKGEKLSAAFYNLALITIRLGKETASVFGVYYAILRLFALEGINVVEIVSTYTELTLVFREKDINRAFSLLTLRSRKF